MVKADRPLMKLSMEAYRAMISMYSSRIVYNYSLRDAGELPGMAMENGVPALVGANGYTLVLNGKPSNIPQETQLLEMLKTIPLQMVANVEISLCQSNRPIQSEGASINVILKTQSKEKQLSGLSGQLFAGYYNTSTTLILAVAILVILVRAAGLLMVATRVMAANHIQI